jgi:hypothetical protein
LSLLTEAEQKLIMNGGDRAIYSKITEALVEQFKKVTNWNIDHEKLYGQLNKVSKFI